MAQLTELSSVAVNATAQTRPRGGKIHERRYQMLSTSLLESLSRLPSPLLTAYVRTTPDEASLQGAAPRYLHFLKEAGRSAAESLASEERDAFSKQLERVTEFLSRPKSHGSFVIFLGSSVWEVVPLQVADNNGILWGEASLARMGSACRWTEHL